MMPALLPVSYNSFLQMTFAANSNARPLKAAEASCGAKSCNPMAKRRQLSRKATEYLTELAVLGAGCIRHSERRPDPEVQIAKINFVFIKNHLSIVFGW